MRRVCAGHLYLPIPHLCQFLPPPQQTIWSTFHLSADTRCLAEKVCGLVRCSAVYLGDPKGRIDLGLEIRYLIQR